MSYTEYLRRKAAGSTVVLNTQKPTDASMITMKRRHEASSVFSPDGTHYGSLISGADRSGNNHRPTSFFKATGRPADASAYTSFLGSQGIRDDAAYQRGRIVQTPDCASCLPELGPAPKSGSDFIRDKLACQKTNGEAHSGDIDEVGPALFVDNTIRNINPAKQFCVAATHQHPEIQGHVSWQERPEKSKIPLYVVPSPDDARKVGDFNPRKLPYVERKHGNDLKVNPRRVPIKYIPQIVPAHLKINDPTFGVFVA